MAIDWNLVQQQRPPGPELASITGLLGAIAEHRARQQQAAADQAFRERQFAAQQANTAVDNARADRQMSLQEQEHKDALEAAKAKLAREENDAAGKALPDVMGTSVDQPQIAQAKAAAAGIKMTANPRDMIDETTDVLDNRVTPPSYSFALPAGQVLQYDTGEQQRAQKAGIQRNLDTVRSAAAPLANIPYSPRVAPVAEALAMAGEKPGEAIGKGISSAQFAEAKADAERNARIAASKNASSQELTAGRGAIGKLDTEAKDFERTYNIPKLNASLDSLRQAQHEMAADSKVGKFAAYESFLKGARGSAPTGYVMEEAQKHTGGLWDRFKNAIARADNGDYSPEVKRDIKRGIDASIAGLEAQLKAHEKNYDRHFGNRLYDEVRGNVDAWKGQIFGTDTPASQGAAISPTGKKLAPIKSVQPDPLDALDAEANQHLGGR